MFIEQAFSNLPFFLSWMLIIVFSICVHEYAHAQAAWWLGDDTAARRGHLSLNPLVQMGWISLVMLALVGIAWGAVPVNPSRMRGRAGPALVAFAGPASNLALALVFVVLAAAADRMGLEGYVGNFLFLASMANTVLFLFNMIPVPMFDGWTVLAHFVPAMRRINMAEAMQYSWLLIAVIWVSGAIDHLWSWGAGFSRGLHGLLLGLLGGA